LFFSFNVLSQSNIFHRHSRRSTGFPINFTMLLFSSSLNSSTFYSSLFFSSIKFTFHTQIALFLHLFSQNFFFLLFKASKPLQHQLDFFFFTLNYKHTKIIAAPLTHFFGALFIDRIATSLLILCFLCAFFDKFLHAFEKFETIWGDWDFVWGENKNKKFCWGVFTFLCDFHTFKRNITNFINFFN
jgi:hypothetical protein